MTYANNRLQDVVSAHKILGYAYDGNDNQIGAIDPDGFATRFEYGRPGRMTTCN